MTEVELDNLKRNRAALVEAFTEQGIVFKGNECKCPFHDDKHPSAGVYEKDGIWRFKCLKCGVHEDVIGARARLANKKCGDVMREMSVPASTMPMKQPTKPKVVYPTIDALRASVRGKVEALNSYTNPLSKEVELVVVRYIPRGETKKKFLQARPVPGGLVMEAPPKPWPIYNRTRLLAADVAIVVEGEKAVHALAEIGIVATTSPGGAGKAAMADWSPLAGKLVYLWHDADEPDPKTGNVIGIEHMNEVARQLEALDPPPRVFWIDATNFDLPPKGDAVEYLALYGGATMLEKRQAVNCALQLAQPLGAARELSDLIEAAITGKRTAIPWPWPALGGLTKALLPGTVTCICGDPGSTKSFLMLEGACYWHRNGVKCAIYELEEDRAYHLNRVLAQLDDNADLTDPDWVRANPEKAREALARHRDFIEGFARCIHTAPDDQPTLDELVQWVHRMAEAGCRVIAIDPVTAATAGDKPWIEDLRFLMTVKTIVRKYGASLVLVTHPRKGRKAGMGLDDLAGGAAYPRFSQTVLWIQRHEKPREVQVAGPCGNFDTTINRSIRLGKTRNGRGAGLELGYVFESKSLRFSEQGVVIKTKKLRSEVEQDIIEQNGKVRVATGA